MYKHFFTSALGLFIALCSFGQTYNPVLIEDMMDANRTGDAVIHHISGDFMYVSGLNGSSQTVLYAINIKDSTIHDLGINSQSHNFNKNSVTFFEYKSATYFMSSKSSVTLWKTDGTAKNTTEILTGKISKILPTDKAIFMEFESDSTGRELYATDGTAGNIKLVKDIYAGTKHSTIDKMTAHNGMLYFVADDSTHGKELWKSDGTTSGTVLVKDFATGTATSSINYINSFNNELYFTAKNPSDGKNNVFKTNGSDTSFVVLEDVNGDPFYSFENVAIWDSVLYFGGNQTGKGIELCRTNGSKSGTYMIVDLDPGTYSSSPEQITHLNGLIYFVADYDKGKELYYTDGTASGTRLTTDMYPIQTDAFINHITALNNILLFSAHSNGNYRDFELYSRGNGVSTKRVKDIYPGSTSSTPNHFFAHNNLLYFTADDGVNGREVSVSDGTSSGTKLYWDVLNNTPDNVIASIASTPDGVFFNASNSDTADELWSFDLSTKQIKNIIDYNGTTRGQPRELMSTPNGVYYSILPGSFDMEINYYDFKTKEITEVLDNGKKNYVGSFRRTNGKFFYTLKQTLLDNIWVYDETTKSTRVVTSSIQPNGFGASAANLTVVGDRVFFTADNYTEGIELYVTDGVLSKLVKDIYSDYYDSRPSFLCSFKDSLIFFSATTPKNGRELYLSDGTSSGTVLLKDIVTGSGSSSPSYMTEGNGVVFFVANDGTNGAELWRTNGTDTGTTLLKDINPGSGSSNPSNLNYHADLGLLFFTTTDSNSIETLWSTDGTANGTKSIRSFVDTTHTSNYTIEFAQSSDKLFFTARTDSSGIELWSSNGSSADLVNDILTGADGSHPQTLTMSNGYLYFTANDGIHGRELWYMNASCLTASMALLNDKCAGDSIYPQASIVSLFDTKSVKYNWYLDDSLMSTNQTYATKLESSGSHTVRLVVTNDEKCQSTSSQSVQVYGIPTAVFSVNQDTQCLNSNNYVFTNTSTGDNLTYAWNFGDNTTQTAASPTKKYTNPGTFKIQMIATEGGICADTANTSVLVSNVPVTSSIYGPNTSDNDEETFTATTSSSNKNTFDWSVTNATILTGQGTKEIRVKWNTRPTTGIIKLIETSPEGCIGNQVTKTCKVNRNASVDDLHNQNITIWPNPSNGQITVQVEDAEKYSSIKVMDYLGKVVYEVNDINNSTSIDLQVPAGIYFIKVLGEDVESTQKIIIQ